MGSNGLSVVVLSSLEVMSGSLGHSSSVSMLGLGMSSSFTGMLESSLEGSDLLSGSKPFSVPVVHNSIPVLVVSRGSVHDSSSVLSGCGSTSVSGTSSNVVLDGGSVGLNGCLQVSVPFLQLSGLPDGPGLALEVGSNSVLSDLDESSVFLHVSSSGLLSSGKVTLRLQPVEAVESAGHGGNSGEDSNLGEHSFLLNYSPC